MSDTIKAFQDQSGIIANLEAQLAAERAKHVEAAHAVLADPANQLDLAAIAERMKAGTAIPQIQTAPAPDESEIATGEAAYDAELARRKAEIVAAAMFVVAAGGAALSGGGAGAVITAIGPAVQSVIGG